MDRINRVLKRGSLIVSLNYYIYYSNNIDLYAK